MENGYFLSSRQTSGMSRNYDSIGDMPAAQHIVGNLFRFYVVVTGVTGGAHYAVISKLKDIGQQQKKSIDQCDYILAFCPSPSRSGTDVKEAMGKIPSNKPVILMVMHHRHDVNAYLDDSTRHVPVTREDVILTADCLYWEGQFLDCDHNTKALNKVQHAVGRRFFLVRWIYFLWNRMCSCWNRIWTCMSYCWNAVGVLFRRTRQA